MTPAARIQLRRRRHNMLRYVWLWRIVDPAGNVLTEAHPGSVYLTSEGARAHAERQLADTLADLAGIDLDEWHEA